MISTSAATTIAIIIILIILILPHSALPSPGWKDQTDWRRGVGGGGGRSAPRNGPHLLPDQPTRVAVIAGQLATLPCRVANPKGRAVSWIRRGDLKVLATDVVTFTTDPRLQVRAWRNGVIWAWDLELHHAGPADSGVYECQVNTRPKLSHLVTLHVTGGVAVIPGPGEVYVEVGSRLRLSCWVPHTPPRLTPHRALTWMHPRHTHRERMMVMERQDGSRVTSTLTLPSITPRDAGNYTCRPHTHTHHRHTLTRHRYSYTRHSAHVTVFVLQDEEPRAMHHDGARVLCVPCPPLLLLLVMLVMILCQPHPFT